jgi:hypothetical protein
VKSTSTIVCQIHAIEEHALMVITHSLVNAILATLDICAKRKSTNVNLILVNITAIAKI